ncbi:chromosome partitioning ATPase [Staphylococcus aureus]|nr:chromosome partitioning ATPase [Staphylococcus aureus]
MKRTYPEAIDEKQTFIDALKTGELEDSIINLSTKLSLLPADSSLANLSDIIAKNRYYKKAIYT